MSRNGKVIVAMSGGVDSSVAACLLKDQGYDCVGVFMRVGDHGEDTGTHSREATQAHTHECTRGTTSTAHETDASVVNPPPSEHLPPPSRQLKHGCCSVADALDARAVAGKLGIPFYALNFEQDFEPIIEYFVDEYAHARTPNPCVLCNVHLKFGKLLRYADMLDAQFVATGHYARILRTAVAAGLRTGRGLPNNRRAEQTAGSSEATADAAVRLARAVNLAKDQSYVLFGIRRADLSRCLFPLGEMPDKAAVRHIAADLGLRIHDKPDSQEICFVPSNDYRQLVRTRRPETQRPGQVRDSAGNVLGRHDGIVNYTIGQRHGLGIAGARPMYVTQLDVPTNTVTLGPREDLLGSGLVAERVNWLTDPPPLGELRPATIKIRHTHTPASGTILLVSQGSALRTRQGETSAYDPVPQGSALRSQQGSNVQDGSVEARFDEPQSAVTPGQAAVFYDADIVLAGGWIAQRL